MKICVCGNGNSEGSDHGKVLLLNNLWRFYRVITALIRHFGPQFLGCDDELVSGQKYPKLEERLRAIGFAYDISVGVPKCRWELGAIKGLYYAQERR